MHFKLSLCLLLEQNAPITLALLTGPIKQYLATTLWSLIFVGTVDLGTQREKKKMEYWKEDDNLSFFPSLCLILKNVHVCVSDCEFVNGSAGVQRHQRHQMPLKLIVWMPCIKFGSFARAVHVILQHCAILQLLFLL